MRSILLLATISLLFGNIQVSDAHATGAPEWRSSGQLDQPRRSTFFRLKNGLTVILDPRPRSDEVEVQLLVRAGGAQEAATQFQAAHVVEHVLSSRRIMFNQETFDGTRLMRAWDAGGAFTNASASAVATQYIYRGAPSNISDVLRWYRAIAFGGSFDPAVVDKDIATVADENGGGGPSDTTAWLRSTKVPTYMEEAVKAEDTYSALETLRPSDVRQFHDQWYRPECEAIIVVGRFDPITIERDLRDLFGGLSERPTTSSCAGDFYAGDTVSENEAGPGVLITSGPQAERHIDVRAEMLQHVTAALLRRLIELEPLPAGAGVDIGVGSGNSRVTTASSFENRLRINLTGSAPALSALLVQATGAIQTLARAEVRPEQLDSAKAEILGALPTSIPSITQAHIRAWLLDYRPGLTNDDANMVQAVLASISPDDVAELTREILSPAAVQLTVFNEASGGSGLQPAQIRAAIAGDVTLRGASPESVVAVEPANTDRPSPTSSSSVSLDLPRFDGFHHSTPETTETLFGGKRLAFENGVQLIIAPPSGSLGVDGAIVRPLGRMRCIQFTQKCEASPASRYILKSIDGLSSADTNSAGLRFSGLVDPEQAFFNARAGVGKLHLVLGAIYAVLRGEVELERANAMGDPLAEAVENALAGRAGEGQLDVAPANYYRYTEGSVIVLSGDVSPERDAEILSDFALLVGNLPHPELSLAKSASFGRTNVPTQSRRAEVRMIYTVDNAESSLTWADIVANEAVLKARIFDRLRLAESVSYIPRLEMRARPDGQWVVSVWFTCAPKDVENAISAAEDELRDFALTGPSDYDSEIFAWRNTAPPQSSTAWARYLLTFPSSQRLGAPPLDRSPVSASQAHAAFADFYRRASVRVFVASPGPQTSLSNGSST